MRISDWSSDVCSSDLCAIAPEGAITNEEPQASASITFPNFFLKPFEAYFIGFIVANFSNISGLCHGLAEPRLSGGSPWRMRHIASGKHDPELLLYAKIAKSQPEQESVAVPGEIGRAHV